MPSAYEPWNETRGAETVAEHAELEGATLIILHALQTPPSNVIRNQYQAISNSNRLDLRLIDTPPCFCRNRIVTTGWRKMSGDCRSATTAMASLADGRIAAAA
jgi:hypothetical protein